MNLNLKIEQVQKQFKQIIAVYNDIAQELIGKIAVARPGAIVHQVGPRKVISAGFDAESGWFWVDFVDNERIHEFCLDWDWAENFDFVEEE